MTGLMTWKASDRYEDGWFIGGELEDGSHTREPMTEDGYNWPFSIYRKGRQPGVTDVVLCDGIQELSDALALCALLNAQGNKTLRVHADGVPG